MLSLTSRHVREELAYAAKEVGIPGAAAAVGSMAGCAITRQTRGVKAVIAGTACVGGGGLMMLKGGSKPIQYAGAGLVFGTLWGLLGR